MNFPRGIWLTLTGTAILETALLVGVGGIAAASPDPTSLCPAPALSRVVRHRVQAGETLEAIAQQYNLISATLVGLNPALQSQLQTIGPNSRLPVGQEILVPPYNGIAVTVPPGQTWEEVATRYNSRSDVLFEVNGCTATVPERVFIPGTHWFPGVTPGPGAGSSRGSDSDPLRGYPLPETAEIIATYGWQSDPTGEKLVFHTGVTLTAPAGRPVLSVGEGTVAFAGKDKVYGNLVVINHRQGLQTRYVNLGTLNVSVGQTVGEGAVLGVVAAVPETEEPQNSFLFFEVRLNSALGWVAQDPQQYIPALGVR